MAANADSSKRICVWVFWVFNLLVDAIYVIMCWATADNLARVSVNVRIPSSWQEAQQTAKSLVSNNIWRAPIAACALGGLMVVLFNLLSLFVLIRKSVMKGGPGFGYGFVVAWAFVMSFFTLMCGLVVEGFKGVVVSQLEKQEGWTRVMSGAFIGAYALSYVASACFMLFFLVLLIMKGTVQRELGIYDQMKQQKQLMEMNALALGGAPINPLAMQMQMQGGPI